MLRRVILLAIAWMACPWHVEGQDFDENNFIRYTRLQGLSNNFISGIVQDTAGYIWIATHSGLNRFDGKTFQSVFKNSLHSPLPDNLVVSMHRQYSNEVIGATRAGAFAFDPVSGQNKRFIIPCDSSIYFWTNHAVDILKDGSGNYIVSTRTGFYVFDGAGKLKQRYDYHTAADVGRVELNFGGLLGALPEGGTFQQNGLLGSVYDPRSGLIDTNYLAKREDLKRLITDTFGDMQPAWCGRNGELFILNTPKNTLELADFASSRKTSNPMPFTERTDLGWASALTYINDSLLTITCRNSGFYLLHYNSRTRQLSCDGRKYFRGNVCTAIFKDRESRLWIGTADGLYKQNLRNSFFTVNDLSEKSSYLIDHEISGICVDDSTIFTGLLNGGGLLVLNKSTGEIKNRILFTRQTAFSNTVINILPYDKDTLWIGTGSGILWLNRNNYHYGRLKTPPELQWMQGSNSTCLFEDSKKNVWLSFGKLNGLVRYDRAARTFSELSPPANPLLKITFVFSMAEDLDGNVWLAGDGLCRWNVKKGLVDTLIPYPRMSKLLRNYMFILDRDGQNNLWLSSYDNEIIQYNCTTNTMYLRQQGNNMVDGNTITSSPIIHGNIWMGTDNGISAFNINDYSVKQFTYADGLPSVDITSRRKESFYDKGSGRFYFGARHRLISFVPDITLGHKVPPALFIEKISARDTLIMPVPEEIRLGHDQDNITIVFNTINFTDPEENRFAWRSPENSDSGWNELNEQGSITLTNLSGGWHSVQVKLFSMNNRWPQQVKTLRIYIRPPFWKTAWFIFLLAACIATGIIIMYRRRVDAVRKKEREKAQVQQLIAEEYKNRLELEQIINYFSSSLNDKKNVGDVLKDVTQNLIRRLGYGDCIILLWNSDKSKMVRKAGYCYKETLQGIASPDLEVAPGEGLIGYVMETHEPVLIEDTKQDRRTRDGDARNLSQVCVPILHNNELIGIIDSVHPEPGYYKERDMNIFTTVATLAGNKILQIESEQTLRVKQEEIASINEQLAEAQLLALQTQMNPHFIFNALNSIKGMILENQQQKASRYLSKFAHMIRMTLSQSREIFGSLHDNKEYLESYLEMEKLRFDNSFSFLITVDEPIEEGEVLIPTLMIQPLVENAIWHGLLHLKGEKKLSIGFYQLGNTITCTIEDNGIGIRQSERLKQNNKPLHKSVGLDNLRNRIKVMNEKYDTQCKLKIMDLSEVDETMRGTRVVLSFNNVAL